ncbi:alpha/beta hydrolase [Agathobaculum sp. TL06]
MNQTIPSHQTWHSQTKKVSLPTGITMYYMEAGDPSAEPLLLIHGFTDSSRIWRETMLSLQDRYHMFAVDLRGFGQTDKPDQFIYTPVQHSEDLTAFLDAVNVDSCFVMGHSMGSLIAQTLAFCVPERVKKLILASTLVRGHTTGDEMQGIYEHFENMDFSRMTDQEMQEEFLPHPENCADPDFPAAYLSTLRGVPGKSLRAAMFSMNQTDNRYFVQFIHAPVLILWGTSDEILTADYQAEVRAAFPLARYQELVGISHEIPTEIPKQLSEIADRFFCE